MLPAIKLLAVVGALAGFASAQGDLPSCAQSCVAQFTSGSSIGGCSNIDIKCICSSGTFISGIACCLASACDQADQITATNFALNFCKAAGVTGLPTAVSCTSTIVPSTSSTPSSTPSAVAGTTSVGSSASSALSSVSSSASSVASSVSSSAASVLSSASSSAASVASSVSSSQSSVASSSTSSSATAAKTSGAASHNMAGMGAGVIGGLAAAVALL